MISEKLFVCWLPPFEVRKSPSSTMKFLVASFADRCRVFFFAVQRKRRNSSCRPSKDASVWEQDGSLFVSACKGGVEVFRFS